MAYSELIKDFNRIREYMREFYVYGFKSRDEYTQKSARSYDNERRRLESWLGDYMQFRQTPSGKNVFLSIDSRVSRHNPLYKGWKTKSFTDGDITLHFILFDILSSPDVSLTITEITERIDEHLSEFDEPLMFDESTVRKKLKEYVEEGIIIPEKHGRAISYHRAEETPSADMDVLDFFSETAPCGVIGSYLLDKEEDHGSNFTFKHHYITSAMDSEILCSLLLAVSDQRTVTLSNVNRHRERINENNVVPLKIMISVQNGRQYLIAYSPRFKRITAFRIDNIISVKPGEICENYSEYRKELDEMLTHMWGISTHNYSGRTLEHVEFTVRYADDEQHIHARLEREKRCGTVERLNKNSSRFTAEVIDTMEMIPWMRTFICRITDINLTNKRLEKQFKKDIEDMYNLYFTEGGDENAVQ